MQESSSFIDSLKKSVSRERQIMFEISNLYQSLSTISNPNIRVSIQSQIEALKSSLRKTNSEIPKIVEKIFVRKSLPKTEQKKMPLRTPTKKEIIPKTFSKLSFKKRASKLKIDPETLRPFPVATNGGSEEDIEREIEDNHLEREIIKRLKKTKKKKKVKKEQKASQYVKYANIIFAKWSISLSKLKAFKTMRIDLIRANLDFPPVSYISVLLLSTVLSFFVGIFLFLFFLFFSLSPTTVVSFAQDTLGARFLKTFWIIFAVPILTFVSLYVYPSLEKKSLGNKIDVELPFAAIHMSAISGSMVDPSKIFSIIILTKEYPNLEKQFTKLINEITVYGYDLVSSLRNTAFYSPSKKLSDLLNGLATTITSGGNLPNFFEKRSSGLLFDYRIEREKEARSAETFMDIYISLVIAAPMILMLLLMMMKISGLGISLSTGMITLIMILGVGMINIFFMMFLMFKQPRQA